MPGSPAPGDQWFVEDLGSTNGTYVGTARITQPTTLSLGTQVRIGKTDPRAEEVARMTAVPRRAPR